MDLRRLSYFVSACQERNFTAAADRLGIRQSTLSGAMKTLAEEFGVPLFEQAQRRLNPTPAGIWLYRSALLLLHSEEFARQWIVEGHEGRASHLIVDIRASFVLGRLGKAVGRAIQRFTQDHPDIFVQPCFSGVGQARGQARTIAAAIGAPRRSLLVIDARPAGITEDDLAVVVGRDRWVAMKASRCRQRATVQRSPAATYLVPSLDKPLLDQATAAVRGAIDCRDEAATTLPSQIAQHPTATFLFPQSLAPDRLDHDLIDICPLDVDRRAKRPPLWG